MRPPLAQVRLSLLLFILLSVRSVRSVNFTQCLINVREKYGDDTTIGGVDNNGIPVPARNATAITYRLCVKECGSDPEPFDVSDFSEQFGNWLLPWLALLPQIPYGANNDISNIMVLFLTVGSPVLAAFSLCMTADNGKWIKKQLSAKDGLASRRDLAARVLNNLQQVPILVHPPRSNAGEASNRLNPCF
jgi:hypothetical protein